MNNFGHHREEVRGGGRRQASGHPVPSRAAGAGEGTSQPGQQCPHRNETKDRTANSPMEPSDERTLLKCCEDENKRLHEDDRVK